MAVLSAKDEEELAIIHRCEEFWQPQDDFKTLEMVPFEDADKLKFHKYMKALAQSLLGDMADLDKEDLVFLLSDDKEPNAAFMEDAKTGEGTLIYISASLLEMCENKDQLYGSSEPQFGIKADSEDIGQNSSCFVYSA